ncbi:hypothetical protein HELRODRAFT_66077, partial [Helobdella robusta]|uniref:RWD domain-containing protein n=1 Tax=Helobdella robusta TaxID=6412 RepID=T1FYG7_HELRO
LIKEEYEVIKSIYEGDTKFTEVNPTTFSYKFDSESSQKSFLVEFHWLENYPEVPPDINLEFFCNKFLCKKTKNKIKEFVHDQAEPMLNSAMLYTIIEAIKEKVDTLLEKNDQDASDDNEVLTLDELNIEGAVADTSTASCSVRQKEKKEKLTKAQKRRLLNRQDKGELPRGWNWVDIISHLSSTSSKDS